MEEQRPVSYLHVHVESDQVELACADLWSLGALGIEERDQTTIEGAATARPVTLAAPFTDESHARNAMRALSSRYDVDLAHVRVQDWASVWKEGLNPINIGRRLYLCPSWELPRPGAAQAVVIMDPENAFGSGTHETTQLVLRELDRRIVGGERVLDVGCGSGILSIAALKLGAARAMAIDIDEDAVAVTTKNAQRNDVADRLFAQQTPIARLEGEYDLIVANLYAQALHTMVKDFIRLLAPRGTLVLSGILTTEWKDVACAYTLPVLLTTQTGDWACLVFGEMGTPP